jgi:hypothetical protein
VMAVAENHVVSDRTIAIDSIARTPQREASELRCKSDVQVDGVVCTWLRYLRSWVVAWLQSTRSRSELALGHRADSGRPVDQEFSRARRRLGGSLKLHLELAADCVRNQSRKKAGSG